jgi:putative ABC transport system substrate-binding protein
MFIGGVAVGLLAAPLVARTQQPDRVRRIGLLLPYIESDSQAKARVTAFLATLQERGWVDGRNAGLFRYSEGQPDRLPALAADLVQKNVDVILTAGTESTEAARKATNTIPIVMAAVGDPIAAGFITNLARPAGNVTGASLLATDLTAKRLQLLKEVLPELTRLAVLWSSANASVVQKVKQLQAAAARFGVQLQLFELRARSDMEKSFASAAQVSAPGRHDDGGCDADHLSSAGCGAWKATTNACGFGVRRICPRGCSHELRPEHPGPVPVCRGGTSTTF